MAAFSNPQARGTTPRGTPVARSARVLIVDDDLGSRETFALALRRAGFAPTIAATGAEALACARASTFDAILIDLYLGDMLGTELVRTFQHEGLNLPFVLIGAYLPTHTIVEAMRLGAFEVLDKPLAVEALCAVIARTIESAGAQTRLHPPIPFHPHSVAERWARLVVTACEADGDPKTLQEWARVAGLSYTSLRELCRILGMRAHDSRDFVRVLRALRKARAQQCPPEVFLDVGDERTVRVLFERAGFCAGAPVCLTSIDDYLNRQRFIDPQHPALHVLRTLLSPDA